MTIPSPTPEGRMSFPRVPVQEFSAAPLEDLAAAVQDATSEGNARLMAAGPILNSDAGYGAGGFSIEEGSAHGWPTGMEPPDYETPLRPGPHGG